MILLAALIACSPEDVGETDTSSTRTPLAGDVALEYLCANQGVEACLFGEDGAAIEVADRAVPLIAGRPMLVRAGWLAAPGLEGRDLVGVLVLTHADGTVQELEDVRLVDGPADRTNLEGSFAWTLDGAEVTPGLALAVEIRELDEIERGEAWLPRLPATGSTSLELVADRMVLDYVVVPLRNPCGTAPVLSSEDRADLEAYIFNLFPITQLDVTYHEAVFVDTCDRKRTLEVLKELRDGEGGPSSAYYQGIFYDDVAPDPGYAWIVGDGPDANRVSYAGWWRRESTDEPRGGIDNAAHELAHNHGLRHPDSDPDTDGVRTAWGYGVRAGRHPSWQVGDMQRLYPPFDAAGADPQFGEVMSYDFPYWISAYSYRKLVERVQTVSALP